MKKKIICQTIASVCLLASCSKWGGPSTTTFQLTSDQGNSPLAEIGKMTITVEGMKDRLLREPHFVRSQMLSDASKKEEYLEHLVGKELLVQEAIKRGLFNSPEVQEAVKRALVQQLSKVELTDNVKLEDVTEAQIKAYYEANPGEFHMAAKTHVSYLFVPFADNKAASLKKASEASKKALSAAYQKKGRAGFAELVEQYGVADAHAEKSKKNEDLGFLTQDELKQKFGGDAASAIAALQKDEQVTTAVEGANGYYVFRREAYREAVSRELADVSSTIQRKLFYEQKRNAFTKYVDGLKTAYGVKIHKDRLSEVKVDTGDLPNKQVLQ